MPWLLLYDYDSVYQNAMRCVEMRRKTLLASYKTRGDSGLMKELLVLVIILLEEINVTIA